MSRFDEISEGLFKRFKLVKSWLKKGQGSAIELG